MLDVRDRITDVDKRIAATIEDEKRPVVLVLNKYDLVPQGHDPDEFLKYMTKALPKLRYAPISMVSALKGHRVWESLQITGELHAQSSVRIPTSDINRALEAAVKMRSPSGRGPRSARIYYAAQKGIRPPRFVVFVNDPNAFSSDYLRYLEDKMRSFLPFHEVPIRLEMRSGNRKVKKRKK